MTSLLSLPIHHDDDGAADLVVTNARIWTADSDKPEASLLVIRDGRFVGVFTAEEATRVDIAIDEHTLQVDAQGRRILPGLIDTHVHLQGAASDMQYLDLRPAASKEELLEMVREYAANFATDAWVIGTRWSAESWPTQQPPTADEIDEASDGRKTVLIRMDGHSLVASRSALEYADITKDGPVDPEGGNIGRAADGNPTGQIYEQAQWLVSKHIVLPDVDNRKLLQQAIAHANAHGITQVGAIEGVKTIRELIAMDSQSDTNDDSGSAQPLTLRIDATIRDGGDSVREWMDALEFARENPHPSPNVSILGFKGFMDGTLGSRTAWMMQPYEDNDMAADKADDNAGYPLAMAATGELAELIKVGSNMGLQPAVHAIGDRSNHELLNWYEAIPAEDRKTLRPRVEHAQHLLPPDIARFAVLDVIPSMQPYHKADDGRYAEQRLGDERIKTSYAFRDLLNSGATLAFGSDWPVVSVSPFLGIHAAVTGRTLDDDIFAPQQSITVEEALLCYTRNAAFALHSEDETGMIREGFAANFVVLYRDILQVDPEDIPTLQVVQTFVNGVRVFSQR